tara:strand:- start:5887 stop:6339 length:453 start_codon:yes stop_codon:yes gene_type:complete
MTLAFNTNRADASAIETHLRACDAQFVPHLSDRVDLAVYGAKMASQAVLFEAWAGDTLVGLVAGYANDPKKHDSFVTNVSVLPDWQGQSIANRLLSAFIDHARTAGFERVVLSVDARNDRARALYHKFGFTDGSSEGTALEMTFNLRTEK